MSPASLSMVSATPADVATALARAAGRSRFVLSPDVVADSKRLTVALAGTPAAVWSEGLAALALADVHVSCGGVGALCRFYVPSSDQAAVAAKALGVLSYAPRARSVRFLSGVLGAMFPGWHFDGSSGPAASAAGAGMGAPAVSASSGSGSSTAAGRASPQTSEPVQLLGMGPLDQLARVRWAVRALDQAVPSLTTRVAVYEVDTSGQTQSAVALVGSILGQTLTLGTQLGSSVASIASGGVASLSLKVGGFQAVLSALDQSSVAHLVTAPVLRGSSGVLSSFAVGDSVPTLGSVSYGAGSSTPVQSIQYQQSGVVFSVLPQLVGGLVHVALFQSVSSFVPTETGVQSSPTLQNRALATQIVVRPGAVVVLGGLEETSHSHGSTGWWLLPDLSRNHAASRTSIVLVLSVGVGPVPGGRPGAVR